MAKKQHLLTNDDSDSDFEVLSGPSENRQRNVAMQLCVQLLCNIYTFTLGIKMCTNLQTQHSWKVRGNEIQSLWKDTVV